MQMSEMQTKEYPAAPWRLNGQLYGSIWSLSPGNIRVELPLDFKLLVNLGRASAFAGFVDYQPGSTLVYHELIGGVVVRLQDSWRCAFYVTHIWVDDAQSQQGGCEIWGVPKELATFRYNYAPPARTFTAAAQVSNGQVLARGHFRTTMGLPRPLKLPVPFPNLQMLHGQPHHSSGTFWSSLQLCRGGTVVPADSPLAALGIAGHKPVVSFAGLNFKMYLAAAKPVKSHK